MPKNHETLIFDLDGTLTRYDTYLAFLKYVLFRRPSRWPRIFLLGWAVIMFKFRFRDNTWLKIYFLRNVLGGLHQNTLNRWSENFADLCMSSGFHKMGLEVLAKHQQQGDRVILASASLDIYVEKLAFKLGIDEVVCTRTLIANEVLQNSLSSSNCYGYNKLKRITKLLGETGRNITAFSDHHSDLPLLSWAEKGICVNPTKSLKRHASKHKMIVCYWT